MANPEHLEILKQGVEVWNKWRDENPLIEPDLSRYHNRIGKLQGVNFSNTDLVRSYLNRATFRNADLRNANFNLADISEVNFKRANLSGANLRGTMLRMTKFDYAELNETDLSYADLTATDFSHAILAGANMSEAIIGLAKFIDVDLSTVRGLDTVRHSMSSYIDIDTLFTVPVNTSNKFLRGLGVPANLVTYFPSLLNWPLQFYKCFISFTEADDLFSERLYNDLQGAGVRCWRWKEDAKWGKTLMRSIDEAVRVYDKLIVICSEQSLNSPAVIREIERALQKEDDLARQGNDAEVLFPIRLDDYIFSGWTHHRKADVIAKNVGDFRSWNEPEKYKKALDRLLRDLKAEV